MKIIRSNKRFNKWWNPDEYDLCMTSDLITYHYNSIDIWWDPDKLCITDVDKLCKYANSSFKLWWPGVYDFIDNNIDEYINSIAKYCSEYFDIWFDKSTYLYSSHSCSLGFYCAEHFDKWWDPDKIVYDYISCCSLIGNCKDYINKWWDPDKIVLYDKDPIIKPVHANITNSRMLICNYRDCLDVWWDPKIVTDKDLKFMNTKLGYKLKYNDSIIKYIKETKCVSEHLKYIHKWVLS